MRERKPYTVMIHGLEHTMLLDDDTAKRLYGDAAKLASDDDGDDQDESGDVANKARRTRSQ